MIVGLKIEMQRKPTRQSRGPNAAEKRFQDYQKNKGWCDAEGMEGPVILHHAEGATFKHNKVLCGHWFVLALSQKADDVVTHGSRRKFREKYGPQSILWARAMEDYPNIEECPPEVFKAIVDWGK